MESETQSALMSRALDEVKFDFGARRVRSDGRGDGHFAARRGHRLHSGVDYEFTAGEDVPSPVSGTIHRLGYCYPDDFTYRLIEILTHNRKAIVRLLYVAPDVRPGDFVAEGDIVGQAQDVAARYADGGAHMDNHVHCEVFVDPAILKGGAGERSDHGGGLSV